MYEYILGIQIGAGLAQGNGAILGWVLAVFKGGARG
jgi:hypothetical protein